MRLLQPLPALTLLILLWIIFTLRTQQKQSFVLDPKAVELIPTDFIQLERPHFSSEVKSNHAETPTSSRYHQSQGSPPPKTTLHTCYIHGNETVTIPTIPNFAILGAQKAGTTSLAQYLYQHPLIVAPKKPGRTEIHYFNDVFMGQKQQKFNSYDTEDEFYCYARQRYAELYWDTNKMMELIRTGRTDSDGDSIMSTPHVAFDKTPAYLQWKDCPEYMKKTAPWIEKLIVVLRNPIDRAFSQHVMDASKKKSNKFRLHDDLFEDRIHTEVSRMKQAGLLDTSFPALPQQDNSTAMPSILHDHSNRRNMSFENQSSAFDAIVLEDHTMLRKGFYSLQLRRWLQHYSLQNILVLNYDDFVADTKGVVNEILQFAGLSRLDSLNLVDRYKVGNYTGTTMRPSTRRYLELLYKPYNDELAELLGEDWRDVWK